MKLIPGSPLNSPATVRHFRPSHSDPTILARSLIISLSSGRDGKSYESGMVAKARMEFEAAGRDVRP